METYKLGNKVKCIIRAFHAGKLGQMDVQYDNQPYTELNDVSATISFSRINTDVSSKETNLFNHVDYINSVSLSDCLLTKKILQLIFKENSIKMKAQSGNFDSDEDGWIYFTVNSDEIAYQVFVYDTNGKLAAAQGEVQGGKIKVKPNENYVVYWYSEGETSLSLDESRTEYVSLDLITEGNKEDSSQEMFIHIAKCAIDGRKNFSLAQNSVNTIELTFNVIKPSAAEIREGKVNFITLG